MIFDVDLIKILHTFWQNYFLKQSFWKLNISKNVLLALIQIELMSLVSNYLFSAKFYINRQIVKIKSIKIDCYL